MNRRVHWIWQDGDGGELCQKQFSIEDKGDIWTEVVRKPVGV